MTADQPATAGQGGDPAASGTTGGAQGTAPRREPTFFGHPIGLLTLFTTELWERFSYYGMRAILLYYLTYAVVDGGLGLDEATGLAVVSIYGTSVYLLSVVGGWLADRVMGARRATLYGGVVIALGHVCLAVPGITFTTVGISLVAIGTGLLKPNVSSMVGELYDRDDPRRSSAFSIFYMGINIGSLVAPLVVGVARAWGGFHAGFAVAAVGMAVALVFFVTGRRFLHGAGDTVPNPVTRAERPRLARTGLIILAALVVLGVVAALLDHASVLTWFIQLMQLLAVAVPIAFFVVMYRSPKVDDRERSRLTAYVPLFVAATLFWMIFEQAASTLSAFAENRTQLSLLGVAIRPEFFQSVNPASIIVLAPVFAWLWVKTGDRPSTPVKFAIGLTLAALSFLLLAGASAVAGDTRSPAWVLVAVYVIQTLGELCLSPVGLAATTLLAPLAFRSQSMALWFLAPALGQAITSRLVVSTSGVSDTAYFGSIGAVALVAALGLFALSPWVRRHIEEGLAEPESAAVAEIDRTDRRSPDEISGA